MSRTNKHRVNQINSLSINSLEDLSKEAQLWRKCPKRNCKGTMAKVLSRYEDHGPLHNEWECVMCQKVLKDPTFKRKKNYKKKPWQKKRKSGYNKNK